jgi:hypothetical protein
MHKILLRRQDEGRVNIMTAANDEQLSEPIAPVD